MTMQVLNYDLSIKNIMCIYTHILLLLFLSLSPSTYNSDLDPVVYCISKLWQPSSIDDRPWHVSEMVRNPTTDSCHTGRLDEFLK